MHAIKDQRGEPRQALYTQQAVEKIPEDLKTFMLGAKRTAFEAGFSEESLGVADMASQLEHIRDYAFIETKGGSKGEKVDYVLC